MGRSGPQLVLGFDGERLVVVLGSGGGGRAVVKQVHSATRPEGVEASDAAACGAWVGRELGKVGGAGAGSAVVCLPRAEVVVRRLMMPPGLSVAELPGAVRLAMGGVVPFSIDGAAVDFVAAEGAGVGGAGVVAVALSAERVAWWGAMLAGAGVKGAVLTTATLGVSRLVRGLGGLDGEAVIGLLVGPEGGAAGCEMLVVDGSGLRFSRAADVPRSAEGASAEALFAAAATEARRTWMAYRSSAESVEAAAVVGVSARRDDGLTEGAARAVAGALGLPARSACVADRVEWPGEVETGLALLAAPLAAALIEQTGEEERLNLAAGRRAPDVGARRRRVVLLAGLLAVVVGGTAMTVARGSLESRREALLEMGAKYRSDVYPRFLRATRAKLRVEHAEAWVKARADWVEHLSAVSAELPSPPEALLDQFVGQAESAVEFGFVQGGSRSVFPSRWGARVGVTVDVAGSVKQSETARRLRERFNEEQRYTVSSKGADVPQRFDWRLTGVTAVVKPAGAAGAGVTGAAAAKKEGP